MLYDLWEIFNSLLYEACVYMAKFTDNICETVVLEWSSV